MFCTTKMWTFCLFKFNTLREELDDVVTVHFLKAAQGKNVEQKNKWAKKMEERAKTEGFTMQPARLHMYDG